MFTQEEEDFLRDFISKQKKAEQIDLLINEKNNKIVELNMANESDLQQKIADANATYDSDIKALAKIYDDQIAALNK